MELGGTCNESLNELDTCIVVEIEGNRVREERRDARTEERAGAGYTHRLLHTICVCSTMFALGWRNGLVGPTFPDLRLIINEDLSKASWIFTAISFGGLLGSVCGGFAYDRLHKIPLFVGITCGLGLVAAVTPYCSHFVAMFIAHVLHGAFASAIDTVATSDIVVIWRGKAGPYMQAIHGIFSVGAILSPFASESFLARKLPMTSTQENMTSSYADMVTSSSNKISMRNGSVAMIGNENDDLEIFPGQLEDGDLYGETRIFIPYLIATGITLIAASLYVIVAFFYGNVYDKSLMKDSGLDGSVKKREYFLCKRFKILFTVLLAFTLTLYVMAERGFTNFLMTFLISYLHWNKTEGSNASATFWATFALGRLSGICIVRGVRLSFMILGFFIFLTFGGVLLYIAVQHEQKILVWISIGCIGYGMSTIFASIFSWLSENVRRLTGKMASVMFIFFSSGAMVFPILVGYLMDHVSQLWFLYTQILMYFTIVICFTCILLLYRVLENKFKSQEALVEKTKMNEEDGK